MPAVEQTYIATDNRAAIAALINDSYPVPQGVIYVTVERDYPDYRKVQVRPDGMWLTYDELAAHFRPVGLSASGL